MFEIRDPIHGFISLNEWEWDVINQPAYQRLRRLRQLAWTDMVYPGAMHTRFEHSLGVMHVGTRLFNTLRQKGEAILRSEFSFEPSGLDRQCQIIRLAALLHDLGHGPFSHAAEELLPIDPNTGLSYQHEDYSSSIVRLELRDVIEQHPKNTNNYHITVDEINAVFSPKDFSPKTLVWKNLVSGQMDADRMDYLLRDSYHAGVSYGKYDIDRVVSTIALCEEPDGSGFAIGVGDDGIHAVEGLLIARYMMFTQLYFHKTRSIYDYHLVECLKKVLKSSGGRFPPPTKEGIKEYLLWDDWRVLGEISKRQSEKHSKILKERNHHRMVYETREVPSREDLEKSEIVFEKISHLHPVKTEAKKSWYKFQKEEIFVKQKDETTLLSRLSPVVGGLKTVNRRRIYVPVEKREDAREIIAQVEAEAR